MIDFINLHQVDVSQLITEEDFQKKAKELLPKLLKKLGEEQAKIAFDLTCKTLKMKGSLHERNQFIRSAGNNFAKEINSRDKKACIDEIIKELHSMKK